MEQQSLLGTLGINWKLFLAQLVNFSIVMLIFYFLILPPLILAMAKRTKRIEEGLKNADEMEVEKKKFDEWKAAEMKKTRNEIDELTRTATDTANQMKQQIIAEAQQQADKVLKQARASMESEKVSMMAEVKQDIATLVVAASEKILRGKLDEKKDKELISESMKGMK